MVFFCTAIQIIYYKAFKWVSCEFIWNTEACFLWNSEVKHHRLIGLLLHLFIKCKNRCSHTDTWLTFHTFGSIMVHRVGELTVSERLCKPICGGCMSQFHLRYHKFQMFTVFTNKCITMKWSYGIFIKLWIQIAQCY